MRLEFERSPEPSQGMMSSTGDEYLSTAKYMLSMAFIRGLDLLAQGPQLLIPTRPPGQQL